MSWIDNALADLNNHEADLKARFNAFLSHLHNEVEHGGGLTGAHLVTAEACERSDEIAAAVSGEKVEPAAAEDGSAGDAPPASGPVAGVVTA
jgi:hypothetical protein